MRKTWVLLPLALLFAAGCEVKDETPQQPAPTASVAVSVPETATTPSTIAAMTTTTVAIAPTAVGEKKGGSFCSKGDEGLVSSNGLTCTTTATDERYRWRA
jgi:hypothetical protein